MITTDLFRFLVFASAVPVFLSVALSAESDPVSGPPAPDFPPVEESSETPDLSGVADSIQLDDLETPASAKGPASDPLDADPVAETPDPLESLTDEPLKTSETAPALDPLPSLTQDESLETVPAPASDPYLETPAPKEKPAASDLAPAASQEVKTPASTEEP